MADTKSKARAAMDQQAADAAMAERLRRLQDQATATLMAGDAMAHYGKALDREAEAARANPYNAPSPQNVPTQGGSPPGRTAEMYMAGPRNPNAPSQTIDMEAMRRAGALPMPAEDVAGTPQHEARLWLHGLRSQTPIAEEDIDTAELLRRMQTRRGMMI